MERPNIELEATIKKVLDWFFHPPKANLLMVDIRDEQIERLKVLLVRAVAELHQHFPRPETICPGCKLVNDITKELHDSEPAV